MVNNAKEYLPLNYRPDENYAREIMQLFSIGLVELNQDGTTMLDGSNQPIPTYDQSRIEEFAKVFTGWTHGDVPDLFFGETSLSETIPMQSYDAWHDMTEKFLLNGAVLPAGQTAEQDLQGALDNIFNHPNVGPFISKQLIQRLVTSNPSPAYVERIANVFADNGSGTRGDLGAVVKAILLDDEARNGHLNSPDTFGKLREPILKLTALWRAFNAQGTPTVDESDYTTAPRFRHNTGNPEMGQDPYGAPSVFNFYRPDYQQPGEIANAGLVAPEFQILTENNIVGTTNRFGWSIQWADMENEFLPETFDYKAWNGIVRLNLSDEKPLTNNIPELINRLDLLLMSGQMSDQMRSKLIAYLTPFPSGNQYEQAEVVYEALYLITTSPEFAVQR